MPSNPTSELRELQQRLAETQAQLRILQSKVEVNHGLHRQMKQLKEEQTRIRKEWIALQHHPAVRIFKKLSGLARRVLKGKSKPAPPAAVESSQGLRYFPADAPHSLRALLKRTHDARRSGPDMLILPEGPAYQRMRAELIQADSRETVSVIMPTYNRSAVIERAIDSVSRQSYPHWELLVVDDGSTDGTQARVEALSQKDPRIRLVATPHGGVSAARDAGLHAAKGDIVAYLDSDNAWFADYLLFMVHALRATGAKCAYSGLCVVDADQKGQCSWLVRRYDRQQLLRNNYIDINIFAHRRVLFEELGGFDTQLRRWVDWDLILRYTRHHDPVEVPLVLAEYTRQKKLNQITLEESAYFKHAVLNKHLVSWEKQRAECGRRITGLASIVIPVYNQSALTEACVRSLFETRAGRAFEVILVNNGCADDAIEALRNMANEYPLVRLVSNYENYGFSLGNNVGVAASLGEYIVLLNNDTEVTDGWLEALIAPLETAPELGATGPRLLYEGGTVQCAGIVFSPQSKIPYHIYRNAPGDAPYVNKQRAFHALTGACLALRAADYLALNGLDCLYANGCEDLDFCFRMRTQLGKRLLYCPEAKVFHHEGRTEGRSKNIMYNRKRFVDAWGHKVQPDDQQYYAEDGFEVVRYLKPGAEADGDTAAYVPELRGKDGSVGPSATLLQHAAPAARAQIGVISIWHVRGVTVLARQCISALEAGNFDAHVLARWESDRFDNAGPVHHPRVRNGGEDPTAEETVRWAKESQLDLVIFMEVHPKDWKRVHVAALKAARFRVMALEHFDILRMENFADYGVFDALLTNAYYCYRVWKAKFPQMPVLLLPWGVPDAPPSEAPRSAGEIQFVHVAGWGGVNNRKNTDVLIQAFAKANPDNARLHLYTQVPVEKYGEACASLALDTRLFSVHEGTVPDIAEAYLGKDMLLWPSKREGLGLPILEALAAGVPVLIADGYMMKQWIIPGEHGVVVPAGQEQGNRFLPELQVEVDQLAEAIRNICAAPQALHQMQANVRRDRDLWRWTWQPRAFQNELGRFLREPGYAFPESLDYVDPAWRAFEVKRRAAWGEEDSGVQA